MGNCKLSKTQLPFQVVVCQMFTYITNLWQLETADYLSLQVPLQATNTCRDGGGYEVDSKEKGLQVEIHANIADVSIELGQIEDLKANIMLYDSLLNQVPLPNDSIALRTQKTTALAQLSSLYEVVKANQVVQDSLQNNYADSILTRNGAIYIGTLHEDNEKAVNTIYANWLKTSELDASQIAMLESIIYQCPKAGGTAVYGARALYATINDKILYDDVAECNSQGLSWRTIKPQNLAKEEIQLFPNPAQQQVNLKFTTAWLGKKWVMYNSLGQMVKTNDLPQTSTTYLTTIDLTGLPQGVYIFEIQGTTPKRLKLLIE